MAPLLPMILQQDLVYEEAIEYIRRFDVVKLVPELVTNFNDSFIHVSVNKTNKLTARVPGGYYCENGDEENTFKRISVVSTISKCLMALNRDLSKLEMYVYEPKSLENLRVVSNEFIVKHKLVVDAHLTGEMWIIRPSLEVNCIGKIKPVPTKKYVLVKHHNRADKDAVSRMYKWDYTWLSVYHINFPKHEHGQLLHRLNNSEEIITTRVSDEINKYKVGQILSSNLTDKQLIIKTLTKYHDLKKHPYYKYLTKAEIELLSQYNEFEVIRLKLY